MGENSPDLRLELSWDFVPKTISELLAEVAAMDDVSMKLTKLTGYLHLLGDEMRKIDAFKRELPLCMLLLKDAIERLEEEAMRCKAKVVGPVMEEFMPSKGDSDEDEGAKLSRGCSEMKSWMSSAQLWNTDVEHENSDIKRHHSGDEEEKGSVVEKMFRFSNFRGRGGAFVPFKGQSCPRMKKDKVVLPVDGLSLSIEVGSIDLDLRGNGGRAGFDLSPNNPQKQEQRKQRRCWSPELHRRFVNALQQLGGAQAATPKQIRELMQVDGLTNDEVKSHLQKYRLHVQKRPAHSAANPSNSLLVTRDQFGDAPKVQIHQSGSPQGPLYLARSAKGVSITFGDSMEEEEDDKSESHSWKGRVHRPAENNV